MPNQTEIATFYIYNFKDKEAVAETYSDEKHAEKLCITLYLTTHGKKSFYYQKVV